MLLDFLYGFIGIIALTGFCLLDAFMVPQIAYWFMTPYATKILEEYGIERKMRGKDVAKIVILTIVAGALFIVPIIYVGIQGVDSGMSIWRLGLRFLIFFWMVSIFDLAYLVLCKKCIHTGSSPG